MSRNAIVSAVVILIIVIGGFLVYRSGQSQTTAYTDTTAQTIPTTTTDQTATSTTTTATTTTTTSTGITMADVKTHNNASSCWTAINGNVYDVTKWINLHPGGAARILALCGTDGTAAFTGQHSGQARPEAELATFKIGALSQ
jgi:cytochrome b involved in lipid metabolism